MECLICLGNINSVFQDNIMISHDKCKYSLHLSCYNQINKCVYCSIKFNKIQSYKNYNLIKYDYFENFIINSINKIILNYCLQIENINNNYKLIIYFFQSYILFLFILLPAFIILMLYRYINNIK